MEKSGAELAASTFRAVVLLVSLSTFMPMTRLWQVPGVMAPGFSLDSPVQSLPGNSSDEQVVRAHALVVFSVVGFLVISSVEGCVAAAVVYGALVRWGVVCGVDIPIVPGIEIGNSDVAACGFWTVLLRTSATYLGII